MTAHDPATSPWPLTMRIGTLILAVSLAAALLYHFRGELNLKALARHEAAWQGYYAQHPFFALAIAFLAYVIVTGLSLPGAAAMTVLYGKLFGFWPGVVLVSFASTLGATVAFLLSRYLLSSYVQQRFGQRLENFNEALARDGAYYLLALRLAPQAPFFLVNLLMGLTPIRARTFWWVSQLGMLPGTCIYVLAGASAPSLEQIDRRGLSSLLSPQFLVALTVLALVPLAARWLMRRFRPPS